MGNYLAVWKDPHEVFSALGYINKVKFVGLKEHGYNVAKDLAIEDNAPYLDYDGVRYDLKDPKNRHNRPVSRKEYYNIFYIDTSRPYDTWPGYEWWTIKVEAVYDPSLVNLRRRLQKDKTFNQKSVYAEICGPWEGRFKSIATMRHPPHSKCVWDPKGGARQFVNADGSLSPYREQKKTDYSMGNPKKEFVVGRVYLEKRKDLGKTFRWKCVKRTESTAWFSKIVNGKLMEPYRYGYRIKPIDEEEKELMGYEYVYKPVDKSDPTYLSLSSTDLEKK